MRVLVTRPASEAAGWVRDLRARGWDALALPLIAIGPAPDAAALAQARAAVAEQAAVMFVSANAVAGFLAPGAPAWPAATRAWATGPGTAQALRAAGVPDRCIDAPPADAPQFDSETLWARVAAQVRPGDRVLLVRGADAAGRVAGRDWLAQQLAAAGVHTGTVASYVRTLPHWPAPALQAARDAASGGAVWLFSSAEAVGNLAALVPGQDWSRARAVATHERIAHAARAAGFGVVCPSRASLDAIHATLESLG